ncbi:MAG TPA: nucleoside hydrolase [Bryobacteraceae bacterium]|nr:nucleoside hydrolase [Bryobacteraceae bacterium]
MSLARPLVALLFAAALANSQPAAIIADTDAGSDDMMAIALLLSDPSVRLDAVTVVNGLAHVDAGARNMGRLLDLAGRKGVPVFAGRNQPLRGTNEFPSEWRKISDDLPGVPLPAAARAPEHKLASDFFVEHLRDASEPVRILALGPLTNIAEALNRDRSIVRNIREIVIMGGAVRVPGNLQDGGVFHTTNNAAEWNIFIDPMAARIVFRSGIPLRLIALDATNKVKIGPEFLRDFESKARSPLARVVAGVLAADHETIDQGIFYAWDPLAAAALVRPVIVKTVPVHIDVKQDGPEEGRTIAAPGTANAKVAVDADGDAFRALFLAAFTK